jgi:hypothetical protein
MPTRKSPPSRTRGSRSRATPSVPALKRRVAALERALEAARRQHARRLAAARREADRRLAGMVHEIAELRHYQAREEALTRLLAERDAQLAALNERPPHVAIAEADATPGHALT